MDLLKLFHRTSPADDPETRIDPAEHRGDDLEAEFRAIILEQLTRGGVLDDCVSIDVRAVGRAPDGRQVYLAMLRLMRWEHTSALRLLLGLPLLRGKVRKAIHHSWLADLTHFSGLWLHPSGQFEETGAMRDLRNMILHLEQAAPFAVSPQSVRAGDHSIWSVPQDLATSAAPLNKD